jgi:NAD-dependent SIR2 family protein deacetylase
MMRGLQNWASQCDHIISVGTSLNVFPAAGLVMDNIDKAIIINKEPTAFDKWARAVYHSDCDEVIDEVLGGLSEDL